LVVWWLPLKDATSSTHFLQMCSLVGPLRAVAWWFGGVLPGMLPRQRRANASSRFVLKPFSVVIWWLPLQDDTMPTRRQHLSIGVRKPSPGLQSCWFPLKDIRKLSPGLQSWWLLLQGDTPASPTNISLALRVCRKLAASMLLQSIETQVSRGQWDRLFY
jgi:hypothetical protein